MKIEHRDFHPIGLCESGELIEGREADIVTSIGERLGDCCFVKASGVSESLTAVDDDPDPDPLRLS